MVEIELAHKAFEAKYPRRKAQEGGNAFTQGGVVYVLLVYGRGNETTFAVDGESVREVVPFMYGEEVVYCD